MLRANVVVFRFLSGSSYRACIRSMAFHRIDSMAITNILSVNALNKNENKSLNDEIAVRSV